MTQDQATADDYPLGSLSDPVPADRSLRRRMGLIGLSLGTMLAVVSTTAAAQSPQASAGPASDVPLCSGFLGDPAAFDHSLFNEVSFGEDPTATLAGMLGCLGLVVVPTDAPAGTGLRVLYLTIDFQNTGTSCDEGGIHCQATGDGPVTASTLAQGGTYHSDFTVDNSPGGSCNIIDEAPVFTFPEGTLTMHSHHEDCKTVGLRIDTRFEVTGGTGAYGGARGGGWELTGDNSPITWVGTFSY